MRRATGRLLAALFLGGALVGGALVAAGCNSSSTPQEPQADPLQLVSTHLLSFGEPSDLAINETGTVLWAVRNSPERVLQLDLNGSVVRTLPYDGHDLEGIAYDPSDSTLWVAEENRREIVHLDLNGVVLSRHALGLTGEHNSGLEGLCLDSAGKMFALNEKNPGMFIELNPDLTVLSTLNLGFAGDYSAITWNPQKSAFWVVSDQSRRLYLWTKAAGVMSFYDLPFPKPEGVAFDPAANLIYVVSDSTNTLYVYRNPVPN